jgi:uncharacterized membrane-anchored protein YitT (DUF2179 family)
MHVLIDTFNSKLISKHRTEAAAIIANEKFQRAVKKSNGKDSYIPTKIYNLKDIDLDMYRTY